MHFPITGRRAALLGVALFAACEQQPNGLGPDFGVQSISLSPRIDTVMVGDSLQLTATVVMNNNQSPRAPNWTSEMTALASVTQNGMVRGLHAGSGFIVASTGNKKDSAKVTVMSLTPPPPVPVATVVVSPGSSTVRVGASEQLVATPEDGNGTPLTGRTVTWATNQPAIATVSASGLVTTLAVGSATITATSEAASGTAAVTVATVPVASVVVSPASASLRVGVTAQLQATTKDSAGNVLTGRTITWGTSNASVATVSAAGLVSGVTAGSATITATSEGKSGVATISVSNVPVASVTVSPATASVLVGANAQLAATTRDSAGNILTGRLVTWTSSDTNVARVSALGLVVGKGAGSATITATSEGKSGTASVSVTSVPVAAVTVSPATASIYVGATKQLAATTKDSAGNVLTGRAITWTSSNTATATVSATGLVTGKAAGTATITATSEGKSGTASVTVALVPVASVSVNPATASILTAATVQLAAATKDSAGNVLTGRTVTWASSSTALATVSASGLVTGVTAGSATITATSEGKNGTASITVTVSTGGCTPAYGTFGVGNWPAACYQPYDPNAWINRPLPATLTVDPNSAAIVAEFNRAGSGWSDGLPEDKCAGCANDYDHPIYWSTATDLIYTLTGCGYSGALNGIKIHAIKGMIPGGGSDAHVVVMDQSNGMEYDFWQATISDAAQTIGGHSCGRLSMTGDGRIVNSGGSDGDGGNAANTGLYSGQIRAAELVAGKITHAIAIDAKCTNGTHVYPASGNALTCGNSTEPADGQFFQLTYSDAEIDALAVPAWKKVVLHAMHQYGFYVDDTFGGDQHSFALHFESDKMYQAFGVEDPFVTYAKQHVGQDITGSGGTYYYQLAPGVDWSRIQVVKPCSIQGTC